MGHGVYPYIGLNEIGSSSPMKTLLLLIIYLILFLNLSDSIFGFIY